MDKWGSKVEGIIDGHVHMRTLADEASMLAIREVTGIDKLTMVAIQNAEAGSGLAEALVVDAKLPAVVGMGYPISEHAARVFASAFYQTLERVGQVDHAVAIGREAVFVELSASRRDWGIPRLYVRIPEGIIFDKI